jgi:hypothetical protein
MDEARDPLMRLQDLQHFLAAGTLEESLEQQAGMAALLVGAASCSIMLLNSGEGQGMRMSVYARHGVLPDAALASSVARGEGIAGRVLASGVALLVADIGAFGICRHGAAAWQRWRQPDLRAGPHRWPYRRRDQCCRRCRSRTVRRPSCACSR